MVMAESTPVKGKKTKKGKSRKVGCLKIIVINNLNPQAVRGNIDKKATIDSDDSTSYTNMKIIVKEHNTNVMLPKEVGKCSLRYTSRR